MTAGKKQEYVGRLERIFNKTKDSDIAIIADALLEIIEEIEVEENE